MEEPEGGTAPLIPQHTVEWKEESAIPASVQFFIASAWVLMLGSIPFILPIIDNQKVTKTQMILGGSMCVVIFGGFYLFTNIILFQSVHFKSIRSLTPVECIYFMSQIITTVGYGDITPAKMRGQIFVALYVIGALFVIAMLVSQIIEHCTQLLHQQREKLLGITPREDGLKHKATVHDLLHPERPSMISFLVSLSTFLFLDTCWIVFFCAFPGENKTVFEAFYMSLITLTTVGFGAITPATEAGMIFSAFFFIVGSASIVNVIGKFCEFVYKMIEFQRFSPEV